MLISWRYAAAVMAPALMALMLAALGPGPAALAAGGRIERVFVIHSHHLGAPQTVETVAQMNEAFGADREVQHYFLDAKLFELQGRFEALAEDLRRRIGERGPPDVVITLDDPALGFAERRAADLFAGAPIVFADVDSQRFAERMAETANVAGVFERYSVSETVALARDLHATPLETLALIVSRTAGAQAAAAAARDAARREGLSIETLDLTTISFSEAARRMAQDRRSGLAYLFIDGLRDASGRTLTPPQAFARLAKSAARPVYVLRDPHAFNGVVGGELVSSREHARAAIATAERILAGAASEEITPATPAPNVVRIDLAAARRHQLRIERLGPEAEIIPMGPNFLQRNRDAIAVMLGVATLFGSGYLVALYINRRIRRGLTKVNEELQARNDALESAHRRIEHQATHDALTGLKNRAFVEQKLRRFGTRDAPSSLLGAQWALLHVDLDHFRGVNDALGLDGGDEVLRVAARRIERRTPPSGFCGRLNGDGFAVCAPFRTAEEAREFCDDLLAELHQPASVAGASQPMGVSIGVALARTPREISQMASRLREADAALHRAKSAGRGRVVMFNARHQLEDDAKRELMEDFIKSLSDGDFIPFFQPQFCARSGRVVSVEALARWRHPKRGVLNPAEFIGVAAGLDKLGDLDRSILEAAVAELVAWRGKGVFVDQLSVNFSARRLGDPALLESIDALDLGDTTLCVELLESIFLDRKDDAMERAIAGLRKRGVKIEIDDFGTGHASVLAVMRRKPDGFKIARELVAPMSESKEQEMLVGSLIEIGRILGVQVIAEGVETSAQRRKLGELGCDVLQGYALGRPMAGDQAASFIAANHRSRPADPTSAKPSMGRRARASTSRS
ncbi:MAG: EAL domain-containing protein [Pseudomonadota bacterium]